MVKEYNFKEIEKKWQEYWDKNKTYKVNNHEPGKENEYCFVLCLPKSIYNNKEYFINNDAGIDVTNNFALINEFTNNSIDYVLLKEGADNENDNGAFVPLYNEDKVFNYNLTFNK